MDRLSERDRRSKRTRDDRDDRDRDHKHRSSRDDKHRERDRDSSDHHHYSSSHRHRSGRERSHEDREGSRDRDSKRENEREGSRERDRTKHRDAKRELSDDEELERLYDRDGSVERRHSSSHKRKERGASEERGDGVDKRARVSERKEAENGEGRKEKKERRKFGDRVKEEEEIEVDRGFEDEKRVNFIDSKAKEEVSDELFDNGRSRRGTASASNGAALESLTMESSSVLEMSLAPGHPLPTKVSSISTTNENKGVTVTRSHEVPGKSSTDGTSSAAGKSGSLSLDALAKAKKALQMQKELSEKLKKIPLLNKGASTSSEGRSNLGLNEEPKAQSVSTGTGKGPVLVSAPTSVSAGVISSSSALPVASAAADPGASAGLTAVPNFEAVKRAQELAARMGFRQDPEFAPLINLFPGQVATDVAVPQKPTKAPVLRLDALGREIDEHGNVVNVTKPSNLSTLKVNINKQKKDAFQILKPELDVDPDSNPHFDERMGINKTKLLRPKRMNFQFVEEGKWSKDAEHIKLKSKFGEAQAKEQKAKQAQLAKAKAAPDINPNLIEVAERVITKEKPKDPIPDVEWWDVPLLQTGTYGDITDRAMDNIKLEKITIYVEHPRPIEPPAEPAPPPPQPLKLTKKEQKKLRTQRRLAREKDKQELIRQGLIEPPKPKVKMSNLMKVLGSEATQDPTRLEKEIRSAAAEREQAHIDRNIARKLTPAERREKKERKLFDESNTLEAIVSVYKINDLSHPQTRFKVDVNAQENRLSGCAVICDGISVVVVEGGNKSIKRYGKLMLKRINWASAVKEEDEDEDESDDKPPNKCVLVWQGNVAKPNFNRFSVHECMTEAAARKIFADAGVGNYWDLAVNYTDDQT
ncbi:protein RDM16 isoform X1 [Quercus suber]|uniref:protein RDM16 isoform X1 n=2 Tax=Quercus suber TaxID=58331 RepID=UPI000CE1640F|nr:protein RDM16 isoform X1 [Quercus suber]